MPPSIVPALSKSQSRNAKKKRSRQLQSVHLAIQKNHTERFEKELVALHDVAKKTKGELARATIANDRLQIIAQSATLDAHIHKRTAENLAEKLVEKDRAISAAAAPELSQVPP